MAGAKKTWYRRSWTELHDLGSSKVVNSAFIWLILIPFLARVLFVIHAETGKEIKLPFNFLAFYYAAFFFTIASAIYSVKCPTVVKLAPTFGAFQAGGYSPIELKNWFHDMAASPVDATKRNARLLIQYMVHAYPELGLSEEQAKEKDSDTASSKLLVAFWLRPTHESKLPDVHNLAVNEANYRNGLARLITTVCYGLGFLLFGIVVLINLWAVILETAMQFK